MKIRESGEGFYLYDIMDNPGVSLFFTKISHARTCLENMIQKVDRYTNDELGDAELTWINISEYFPNKYKKELVEIFKKAKIQIEKEIAELRKTIEESENGS